MTKRGIQDGVQIYFCKDCKKRFRNKRREDGIITRLIWIDYVFHKQTLRELTKIYSLDKKTVYSHILKYTIKEKKHNPRAIRLLVDALYFGDRKEKTTWCVVVFRDDITKENLWWTFTDTETTSVYVQGKYFLEEKGYTILSVTGDVFSAIRQAFLGIPYQMCHVHMERLVIRGTTRNPLLLPGQVLLALARSIFDTNQVTFTTRLNEFTSMYRDFLNEKTTSVVTGQTWYVHDGLRSAYVSIKNFLPYLFTYEKDIQIPRNTNSLEGHFAHIRDVVNIHRGASRSLKEKMLHTILLASTISPKDEELGDIL